jgi:hypothetical protein
MSNQIQEILSAYEERPPEENWFMISKKIDEDGLFDSDPLYSYEQDPGNAVWDKIQFQLKNTGNKATIVNLFKSKSGFLKFGIAAAILILLSIIAVTIFNVPRQEKMANNAGVNTPVKDNPLFEDNKEDPIHINEEIKSDNPDSKNTTASSGKSSKIASRYLTVSNEDGKKVRLSKKAYNVFNCAENSTALNNSSCKESIQSVRKKMAVSMLSSSGDFGGLMDMIKTLEENN